jgi:hypothetical protein
MSGHTKIVDKKQTGADNYAAVTNSNLHVQVTGTAGDAWNINESGQAHVVMSGTIDGSNSSNTILATAGVFTGSATNLLDYSMINVSVFSDKSSATDGLSLQQSCDGANWDITDEYTIPASKGKTYSVQAACKFFRIVYTNGATTQGAFRLNTLLKKNMTKPSSHRIQDSIIDDDDAELTKAVVTGKNPAGNFVNVQTTTQGNFKISLEELDTPISDDSNASLKVSPYSIDEFGTIGRILSDNYFRGGLVNIPVEHHEIHCGDSYEATFNTDLGGNSTQDILIVVPNEGAISGTNGGADQDIKQYHLEEIVEVENEASVTLYEGASVSASGSFIQSFNRNRNSSNTDTLGVYSSPTITSLGATLWGPWVLGSGRGIGGSRNRDDEFVLKNNTNYIVRVINNTANANQINVELDYYVHPGV